MDAAGRPAPRPPSLREIRPLHSSPAPGHDPRIHMSDDPYKSWQCRTCGFIYDEAAGAPDEGLAPGTRWADIPDDWVSPQSAPPTTDSDILHSYPQSHQP